MMKDEKKLKMTFCRECNPRAVSSSRFQLHGQRMIFCFLWQGHKDHSNATKEIASDGKQIWHRINALALCRKLIAILQGESAREPNSRNTGGKQKRKTWDRSLLRPAISIHISILYSIPNTLPHQPQATTNTSL